MEFDFLSPVDNEIIQYINGLSSQHLGSKVAFHTDKEFPDIDKVKIAIIGVLENRGAVNYVDDEVNLDAVRKELYSLFPGNWQSSIADLGDIIPGNSLEDTFFALQKVAAKLIRKGIIPIVIGGSQDLTYPLYRAYDNQEQMVNLVSIDSKFDFGKQEEVPLQSLIPELLDFVDDVVDELGSREALSYISTMLKNGTGADRQLEVFNRSQNMESVVDYIIQQTKQGL